MGYTSGISGDIMGSNIVVNIYDEYYGKLVGRSEFPVAGSFATSLGYESNNKFTVVGKAAVPSIEDQVYANITAITHDEWSRDVWQQINQSTLSARTCSAVSYGNKIYFFGGANNFSSPTCYNDFYSYDTVNNTWQSLATGPSARCEYAVEIYGPYIYIFGGYDGTNYFSDFWEYNITTNAWTQKAYGPSQRRGSSLTYYNNKFYLFGGLYNSTYYNTMWEYDITFNAWVQKNSGASARHGHYSAEYRGKIYIACGKETSTYPTTAYWYDVVNNNYIALAPAPVAGMWRGYTFYNNSLYLVGGYNPAVLNRLERIEFMRQVNTTISTNTSVGAIIKPAVVACNGNLYIFGGGGSLGATTNAFWKYTI